MTDTEINRAIAEACGWVLVKDDPDFQEYWEHPNDGRKIGVAANPYPFPDYVNDLNAMYGAEDSLLGLNKAEFAVQLCRVVGRDWPSGIGVGSFAHIHATAAQRAEAFLRTIDKWEEVADD